MQLVTFGFFNIFEQKKIFTMGKHRYLLLISYGCPIPVAAPGSENWGAQIEQSRQVRGMSRENFEILST